MTRSTDFNRRGITLMEVLIAIGILAVGLTSVVALVPAGKSEAGKAVMLDRTANLAMNVLNDAVTFGLTRPASIAFDASVPHTSALVMFDPLITRSGSFVWSGSATGSMAVSGTLQPKGIFASTTDSPAGAGLLLTSILEGRDDLLYTAPATDDTPPTNAVVNGTRSFQGRTTALMSLAAISGTLTPGSLAKLTAVVFHGRNLADATDAVVPGTFFNALGTIGNVTLPDGRSLKDVIRPGTVVYCPSAAPSQAWYQVAMASVDEGEGVVYVTFVDDIQPPPPLPGNSGVGVQIALDSVGLAERIVTLEGSSPYAQ